MRTSQNNKPETADAGGLSSEDKAHQTSPGGNSSSVRSASSKKSDAVMNAAGSSASVDQGTEGRKSQNDPLPHPATGDYFAEGTEDGEGFGAGVQKFADKIKNFIKGNKNIPSLSSLVKSINSLPGFSAVIEAVAKKKPLKATALRSEESADEAIRIIILRDGKKWFQQDSKKGQGVLLESTAQYMYENYIKLEMR